MQGDERDVILLSVGYGPDVTGKTTMAFGPLNRQNGWRRLNVAVTRARRRVEVISSLSAGDISSSDDNASRNFFKRCLDYAERGPIVLHTAPASSAASPESPFEESVLDILVAWGYDVQLQVGVAGYRIDLAVRHPRQPGRYALGIECDGAMYHSSRAARDRDRLREEVLRGLGWTLHRIWGTDWYRERAQAEQRLRTAIEEAISRIDQAEAERAASNDAAQQPSAPAVGEPSLQAPDEPVATVDDGEHSSRPTAATPRVRMVAIDTEASADWAVPYRRAQIDKIYGVSLDDPRAKRELVGMFRKVLHVEAPIHQDVLFRRVADACSVGRIREHAHDSLTRALRSLLREHPDVIEIPGRSSDDAITLTLRDREVIPRSNSDGVSRSVKDVPAIEREVALLKTIKESPGISEDELRRIVARVFGWRRTGPDIKSILSKDLTSLAECGRIEGLPDRIRITALD